MSCKYLCCIFFLSHVYKYFYNKFTKANSIFAWWTCHVNVLMCHLNTIAEIWPRRSKTKQTKNSRNSEWHLSNVHRFIGSWGRQILENTNFGYRIRKWTPDACFLESGIAWVLSDWNPHLQNSLMPASCSWRAPLLLPASHWCALSFVGDSQWRRLSGVMESTLTCIQG